MFKRYLLTLLALLLLPCLYALLLSPLLVLRNSFSSPHYAQILCFWGASALLLMLLIGNNLLKKIWVFHGADKLTLEKQLRQRLLEVNKLNCPVTAIEKRKKIIFTWRYKDIAWCGMLSRMGIGHLYELHCRIDADSRTVFLVDRIRRVDFLICPDRVKTGCKRICLPVLRTGCDRLKNLAQYGALQPHDYDFVSREIKGPVLGTLLEQGWNVRFSLF